MMFRTPQVSVYCPTCRHLLGTKDRNEIKTFTCHQENCSETEHTFYPGKAKRPERSVPWAAKRRKTGRCGCGRHPEEETNSKGL